MVIAHNFVLSDGLKDIIYNILQISGFFSLFFPAFNIVVNAGSAEMKKRADWYLSNRVQSF